MNLKRFLLAGLRVVSALWAIAFALLYFSQEQLIFPGTKLPENFTFHFNIPFEERTVLVDGQRIHSLLFHPKNSKGRVLYFHGNAGDLQSWGEAGQELAQRISMDVWMPDYPGYGKSEGSITSESQLHRLGAAFFEATQRFRSSSSKLIIFGRSIGTGIAVKLASENPVSALILETPYLSLQEVASEKAPWAPLFLLKYTFRSDQWIQQVRSPVMILHGDQDEVIPFHQGRDLSTIATGSTFVPIPRGHHNDLSVFPRYWSSLDRFISKLN